MQHEKCEMCEITNPFAEPNIINIDGEKYCLTCGMFLEETKTAAEQNQTTPFYIPHNKNSTYRTNKRMTMTANDAVLIAQQAITGTKPIICKAKRYKNKQNQEYIHYDLNKAITTDTVMQTNLNDFITTETENENMYIPQLETT